MVLYEKKGEGILVITVLPRDRINLGLIPVFFLSFLYDHWQTVCMKITVMSEEK